MFLVILLYRNIKHVYTYYYFLLLLLLLFIHLQEDDTNMKSKMEDVYNQAEKVLHAQWLNQHGSLPLNV